MTAPRFELSLVLASVVLALVLTGCGSDAPPPAPLSTPRDAGVQEDSADPRGPDSPEAEVVAGIRTASNLRVLWLVPAGAAGIDCRVGNCIEGNAVSSGALLNDPVSSAQVAAVLREWLVEAAPAPAGCAPEYRRAVAFASAGRQIAVLLDYDCGNYRIVSDSRTVGSGSVRPPSGPMALDELVERATADDGEGEPEGDEEGDVEEGADGGIEGGDGNTPAGA